jgi:hypothetical protein
MENSVFLSGTVLRRSGCSRVGKSQHQSAALPQETIAVGWLVQSTRNPSPLAQIQLICHRARLRVDSGVAWYAT